MAETTVIGRDRICTMRNKKSVLYSICLLLFMDAVGSVLIFPILPALFMNQEHGLPMNDSYLSREVLYGLSLAMFPLSSIFGMPILGQMADIYGKGRIILYGLFGIILTNLLCIVAVVIGNVSLFLFSRLLVGFLAGTYSAGMAMISDISDNDEDRISNFKLSTLASLIGVLLGPSFSIFVDDQSQINPFIIPFLVATIIGILNFMLLWFNFERIGIGILNSSWRIQGAAFEIYNTQYHTANSKQRFFSPTMIISSLFYVFTNASTCLLSISFLLLQFGLGLYNQSLSLFLVTTFSYKPQNIGILLIITSIATMVSMYIFQPLITKYYNYQLQIKISIILTSFLLILYTSYSYTLTNDLGKYERISLATLLMLYLSIPFITLGFTNLFASSVDRSEQGKIMGGLGQISSLATIISGLLVGKLLSINYCILLALSAISLIFSYVTLRFHLTNNAPI